MPLRSLPALFYERLQKVFVSCLIDHSISDISGEGNLDENVQWYLDHSIINGALEKPAALADIEEVLKLD